ncbi:hypothetical protein J132_02800 [Termitomyces sp. J132]|nr:hypothetical protein J132_02800 [Termitomyces sp. J132]
MFIGGFQVPRPPVPSHSYPHFAQPPPSPIPPTPPPKDAIYTQPGYQPGFYQAQTQQPPPPHFQPQPDIPPQHGGYQYQPGYHYQPGTQSTTTPTQLTQLSAVERSQALRIARMDPHLQFMVGPLLRYDTVDEFGIWHGAAMIVTADSGSIYEPHPTLTYEWDPDQTSHYTAQARSFDLGPHPADPHSTILSTNPNGYSNNYMRPPSSNVTKEVVPGQEIHVYGGPGGTFTFWRFLIQIPLGPHEMNISYSINSGQKLDFYVPGLSQNMRWATYSCNGFSAGVNQDDFCGPGFKSGYDPVWMDLLAKHNETPFHALVGGGDQLYCDSLMREPELQRWITMKPDEKLRYPLTDEIASTIDRANSSMCVPPDHFIRSCLTQRTFCLKTYDEHVCCSSTFLSSSTHRTETLADPNDLQKSPVFQRVGIKGYFYFLLFQCFINPDFDGYSEEPGRHWCKSLIIGNQGPFVQARSHSFLAYLGPQCRILLLDCRGERSKEHVCSRGQYDTVFSRLDKLPSNVQHLIVQLGIPIAYPRMVFLETALDSKLNPLVAISRAGSLGLSGFVNKFNAEPELLDDLLQRSVLMSDFQNDHWTARIHKKERNNFIERSQNFALQKRIRVTFVSGDVHCAAVGVLKTLRQKGRQELAPWMDYRYMVNIVTSAIVNTPPPNAVIGMVSSLATKVHKTMHYCETDETMIPLFENEPNGQPRKQRFIMGRRNWCAVYWDQRTEGITFDIRVEKEKGHGETAGYTVHVPPPAWPKPNRDR